MRSSSGSELGSRDPNLGDEKDAPNATSRASAQAASEEAIDADAQAGVQRMQALATVWSRSTLIAAYVMYVERSGLFFSSTP